MSTGLSVKAMNREWGTEVGVPIMGTVSCLTSAYM